MKEVHRTVHHSTLRRKNLSIRNKHMYTCTAPTGTHCAKAIQRYPYKSESSSAPPTVPPPGPLPPRRSILHYFY